MWIGEKFQSNPEKLVLLEIALGLASIQICGGRALNFLGGVKAYRRISNSECRVIDYRESDCTR